MDDGYGAQERVDDGSQVFFHEGSSAGACGVDEEEGAVGRGEFYEAVVEEGSSFEGKHLGVFVVVGRRDVSLDYRDVDAPGRDDWTGRRGQEL